MPESKTLNAEERFNHLYSLISSQRFLNMEGLGNEVPFFICPYPPQDAIEMERLEKQLANKLNQNGVTVLEINLYDLSIELLKKEAFGNACWQ